MLASLWTSQLNQDERSHRDKNGVRPAAGAVDMHLTAFDVAEDSGDWISGAPPHRCIPADGTLTKTTDAVESSIVE